MKNEEKIEKFNKALEYVNEKLGPLLDEIKKIKEDDELQKLKQLKKQGLDLLKEYYNPHCQIIIDSNGIKITSDEIFIPAEEK